MYGGQNVSVKMDKYGGHPGRNSNEEGENKEVKGTEKEVTTEPGGGTGKAGALKETVADDFSEDAADNATEEQEYGRAGHEG